MRKNLKLIVLGAMGRTPFAGMTWEALHYLEGFRRLDHDVYYIEDTSQWPYFAPGLTTVRDACRWTAGYLCRVMTWCGMADRWAYRAAAQKDRIYGFSDATFARIIRQADVVVNLTGSSILRDEYFRVPIRVYLETDPGLPQIEVAQGNSATIEFLKAHTHHFTFAENLGAPDCGLPAGPFHYYLTRQPIVLEWFTPQNPLSWKKRASQLRFTTVAHWQQNKDVEWNGEVYTWSKHHEFLKFIDLPRRVRQRMELALALQDQEAERLLASHGWRVIDAFPLTTDILPYRDYILASDGEFTVAKDQNVRLRSGWFSERSACYLTAGKPVITQDTGFGRFIPTGEGLFPFNTMEEIITAFKIVVADYGRHSRAARAIAEEYFKAETVLQKLLAEVGV